MLVVGLTGGIGSGKSTFARLLAERGAEVIDADKLGRAALSAGSPAWRLVIEEFGPGILIEGTQEIDRARLAGIVFNDQGRLAALNSIVHPVIAVGIATTLERLEGRAAVAVVDAALIVGTPLQEMMHTLVVLDAPESVRRARLAGQRDMSAADVDARMRSQADPDELVRQADIVVTNEGDLSELEAEADSVWAELTAGRSKA